MIANLKLSRRAIALLFCVAAGLLLTGGTASDVPAWVGKGKYRILVRVDPVDIHGRASDEMPTRIHISAGEVAKLQRSHRVVQTEFYGFIHLCRFVAIHDAVESLVHQGVHQT